MTTTEVQKASPSAAGCWIDGHWGQYGVTRLIDIAKGHGMVLDWNDDHAVESYRHDIPDFQDWDGKLHDAAEWVLGQGGIGENAEEWLNEHVAPEGYSFGWCDGEFFLWSTDEWSTEYSLECD